MISTELTAVVSILDRCRLRYLLVGGMAVVAHGFLRLTNDIDLVLDLEDGPGVTRFLEALSERGYRPRQAVPIADFADFADAGRRRELAAGGAVLHFELWRKSPDVYLDHLVDLFLAPPFDFEAAWERRLVAEVLDGVMASFVDRDTLCSMKYGTGRPKDAQDIAILSRLDA